MKALRLTRTSYICVSHAKHLLISYVQLFIEFYRLLLAFLLTREKSFGYFGRVGTAMLFNEKKTSLKTNRMFKKPNG